MTNVSPPRIILACENSLNRPHWESALLDPSIKLVQWPPAVAAPGSSELSIICALNEVDVICTDSESILRQLEQTVQGDDAAALGLVVIEPQAAVGAAKSALEFQYQSGALTRVRLPAYVHPAVLKLTCRQLTDTVRLRRQIQRAGETHQDLTRQAMIDPLTELPNRRAWDAELARRVSAAAAGNAELTLAILDLDYFKQINDVQGHEAGDATLQRVAEQLRNVLREHDFVARLGGDEFGVLLSDVDRATAERIVERIRQSVSGGRGNQPAFAASAGLASRSAERPLSGQQLTQAADRALLMAKRTGRGKTMFAGET